MSVRQRGFGSRLTRLLLLVWLLPLLAVPVGAETVARAGTPLSSPDRGLNWPLLTSGFGYRAAVDSTQLLWFWGSFQGTPMPAPVPLGKLPAGTRALAAGPDRLWFLGADWTLSSAPLTLTHQGRLLDSADQPVTLAAREVAAAVLVGTIPVTLGKNGGITAHDLSNKSFSAGGLDQVVALAAMPKGVAALRQDGTVWVVGLTINEEGVKLAPPSPVEGLPAAVRIAALGDAILALTAEGALWAARSDHPATAVKLPAGLPAGAVKALAGGDGFLLILMEDGSLFTADAAIAIDEPGVQFADAIAIDEPGVQVADVAAAGQLMGLLHDNGTARIIHRDLAARNRVGDSATVITDGWQHLNLAADGTVLLVAGDGTVSRHWQPVCNPCTAMGATEPLAGVSRVRDLAVDDSSLHLLFLDGSYGRMHLAAGGESLERIPLGLYRPVGITVDGGVPLILDGTGAIHPLLPGGSKGGQPLRAPPAVQISSDGSQLLLLDQSGLVHRLEGTGSGPSRVWGDPHVDEGDGAVVGLGHGGGICGVVLMLRADGTLRENGGVDQDCDGTVEDDHPLGLSVIGFTPEEVRSPTARNGLTWPMIAAGPSYYAAQDLSGAVWVWGQPLGQLVPEPTLAGKAPAEMRGMAATSDRLWFLGADAKLYTAALVPTAPGVQLSELKPVPGVERVKAFAVNERALHLLLLDGSYVQQPLSGEAARTGKVDAITIKQLVGIAPLDGGALLLTADGQLVPVGITINEEGLPVVEEPVITDLPAQVIQVAGHGTGGGFSRTVALLLADGTVWRGEVEAGETRRTFVIPHVLERSGTARAAAYGGGELLVLAVDGALLTCCGDADGDGLGDLPARAVSGPGPIRWMAPESLKSNPLYQETGSGTTNPLYTGAKEVVLQVGSSQAIVDKADQGLDASPYIRNDRTLVPIRFIAEALGLRVGWDGVNRVVTLSGVTPTGEPVEVLIPIDSTVV
ncbi:MAG: stalk domain-containing protein, partial [Bacillota bacterium]